MAAVCLAPFAAGAKPVGSFQFAVTDPGDQVDPSIDGQYVVFAGPGPAGDGSDVLLFDTRTHAVQTLAGGPGDQDSPDVSLTTAAYRTPQGVALEAFLTDASLRAPDGDTTAARPAVGGDVAAWETGAAGTRDIVVDRFDAGEEYRLALRGDQRAPAAAGSLVAYVDGGDQASVWIHDSATKGSTRVCDGAATSVSIAVDGTGVFLAVARSTPAQDDDIEVYDAAGNLKAALHVAGVQRNPHLSGDWVAFEDVSTQWSQVVLWRWRGDPAGLVFVPRPSETDQRLNDVSFVAPEEVRVVFEDSASVATGRDIALYTLDIFPEIVFDDQPNGFPIGGGAPPPPTPEPARCDDPAATVLARLALGREKGKPFADERAFTAEPPAGARAMPVLVCIEANRVSAAWVTLDDQAIASPSDFEPHVVHVEARGEVGRSARVSGVIAGKPGAGLTIRVLADPARAAVASGGGAGAGQAAGEQPAKGGATASGAISGSGGCSATGSGGLASLAALAILLGRRRTRRR